MRRADLKAVTPFQHLYILPSYIHSLHTYIHADKMCARNMAFLKQLDGGLAASYWSGWVQDKRCPWLRKVATRCIQQLGKEVCLIESSCVCCAVSSQACL